MRIVGFKMLIFGSVLGVDLDIQIYSCYYFFFSLGHLNES